MVISTNVFVHSLNSRVPNLLAFRSNGCWQFATHLLDEWQTKINNKWTKKIML